MCDQQNLNELFNDSILPQFRSWINFLTEISPHEVSWDEHRSDAESVKILYNYSIELSKYADRINGCSGILKFGVNPDEGKLVLKQAFFCRVRHCPVCQWRRSLLWRAVMFQQLPNIQERFPTHRWVFLTSPWKTHLLPNCVTPWSTWMIHGSDWLKPSGLSRV